MSRFTEKKIKGIEEKWQKCEDLLSEYRDLLLNTTDPSKKREIEAKIEELKQQQDKFEQEIEALEAKPQPSVPSTNTALVSIKEEPVEELSQDQLIKAMNLLRQKKETAYSKLAPSKKEIQEIHKLEEEINKLFFGGSKNIPISPTALLTTLSALFEEIAFSTGRLGVTTIEKIRATRDEQTKQEAWVDKSVIVSALTLRIISNKKIDSKDWNLLIDFLTDFEARVWERALCGLVLAFQFHHNKMKRFTQIIQRLERLKDVPDVQKGLRIIDFILISETYRSGFLTPQLYEQAFFENNPMHYFLPFYKANNPLVEKALEEDVKSDIDHAELLEEFETIPFSNALKYNFLQQLNSIPKKDERQAMEEQEVSVLAVHRMLHISAVLSPFQNLIQEYYAFATFFSKDAAKELFSRQQSIANTPLKDILLAEKEKLFLSARLAFRNKKYRTAIQHALKGLELDGNDQELLSIISTSYLNKKYFKHAITYLKKLLVNNPQDVESLNRLGESYLELKEYDIALKYYQDAQAIAPQNRQILNGIGEVLTKLKRYQESISIFEKLSVEFPENHTYYAKIAYNYAQLKEYHKALENYQQAIKIKP